MIKDYMLPRLVQEHKICAEQMEEIVRLLAQAPLLYDDGRSIQTDDFLAGLEMQLTPEERRAVTELYELAVTACRRCADETAYEQLQDVLGLQAELWQEGVLSVSAWMVWLEEIGSGKRVLPEYDFVAMLGSLPEGFMIHDFYDVLREQLEQNPAHDWARQECAKLYAALGAGNTRNE
ncbi:hypothetical protein [Paenibacillus sp. JJ-223]|uniref:hypothetical protein n=1 Tax=Paenibacillus sp. JJ-223 TaxID=2905647 RepID=UPI001F3E9FF9|nr:hypothetical protein [Paenibacillus sp. JJ-223]CAH1207054.1 hypothetical protein PAECIP111890_02914 [Paenibacillus sp. JJ-223]